MTKKPSKNYPTEEWREVTDFPGYIVSSLGRVMSTEREITIEAEGRRVHKRKLQAFMLKPRTTSNGYLSNNLSRDGKLITKPIHHLVAEAFLGPRPGRLVIDHINGIKHDNRAENLRYVTQKKNLENSRLLRNSLNNIKSGMEVAYV